MKPRLISNSVFLLQSPECWAYRCVPPTLTPETWEIWTLGISWVHFLHWRVQSLDVVCKALSSWASKICSHLQQCKLEIARVFQPIQRQLNIPKQYSHYLSTEVPRVMPKAWPLQWFLSFSQWHSQVINNLPLPWAEDAKLRTSAEREDDHNTTVRKHGQN